MSTTDGADDVPFYLMPVAAVLGMLAAFSLLRLIYLIASSFKKSTFPYAYKPPSSAYMILAATFIGTSIGYAKVVAQVNYAMELSEHRLFDPFELLEIDVNANTTVIKQAYRSLSKIHHPDKGGSPQKFQSINLAYQALTDQTGMENYKKYGHPQGPPSSHSLDFALPEWLLHPQGNVVFVLLFLYLGMFVLIIYTVIKMMKKDDNAERHVVAGNVVAQQDMAYIASNLLPTTSHLDILYLIATSPTNLQVSEQALEKIQKLKQERLASSHKKKKKSSDNDFELDMDSGWADEEADDDEKEAAQKARQLEEEQKKERLALAKAQGTETVLLEGVDDGVLGQAWVEATLTKNGKWPPQDLGFLEGKTFPYKGKQLSALEHPVVRRNLCITHGRLNSNILNGHTELLDAGSKGLIDTTYFQATAEFRQRAGPLIEKTLQIAIALRSYRLTKTVIEAVTMFKIGTQTPTEAQTISWFQGVMNRQYGCSPKVSIGDVKVYTDDEDEIATNDTVTLSMDLERLHAENFTRQKVELCKKQGIPPQVAMQAYREGWWIVVRAEKLDGGKMAAIEYEPVNDQMEALLKNVDVDVFKAEEQENRLVTARPLMFTNCAQAKAKINLEFKAPPIPGKYRFHIALKTQEFLGADQNLTCERTIVDEATVTNRDDEAKKDK